MSLKASSSGSLSFSISEFWMRSNASAVSNISASPVFSIISNNLSSGEISVLWVTVTATTAAIVVVFLVLVTVFLGLNGITSPFNFISFR